MSADTEVPPTIGGIHRDLEAFLRTTYPDAEAVQFDGLAPLDGGLSRENWVFQARWTDATGRHDLPMILRRDPSGGLLDTHRWVEFELLRALENTAVPAPAAYWIDPDGTRFGSPALVMERLAGSCDPFVLNGPLPLSRRVELAQQFLELLVTVQGVDWAAAGLGEFLDGPGDNAALTELNRWESELRRVQLEPYPELDLVLSWLRPRARAARRTVLVHGDFKPGNALIHDGRVAALLDWETAHLGDPVEDLGWITNPVRSGEHQIPGTWERDQIVAAFSAATGYEVYPDELLWWNVFSCWKLATIVLTGVASFVDGTFDKVHQMPTWLFRAMFKMMGES